MTRAGDPRDDITAIKIHMPAHMREELLTRARRSCPGEMSDDKVIGEYLRRAVSLQRFVEDAGADGVSLHDAVVKSEPRGPSFNVNAYELVLSPSEKATVILAVTRALECLREGLYLDARDVLAATLGRLTHHE